uniref:DUF3850 domain-containing protein n=1 Tax=Steinernema glaseri TaxID=37863 RepID=A0A1I8ALD4_9BILA
MSTAFTFSIKRIRFDEHYRPAENTRTTTNFANLARGQRRQENLRNTLTMIDNRFNALAHWDNPKGDRYNVELEIISVEMNMDAEHRDTALPLIEILQTTIVDRKTSERIEGIRAVAGAQQEPAGVQHAGGFRRAARQAVQAFRELEHL